MALDEPFELFLAQSWQSGRGFGRLCSGKTVVALAVVVLILGNNALGHLVTSTVPVPDTFGG